MHDEFIYTIFLIFSGAAVLATIALLTRQALLVAYIFLGVLFGPSALGLISNPQIIQQFSNFGIIFLLFLLGLNLEPQNLFRLIRETTWVTVSSSVIFAALGTGLAYCMGFDGLEAAVVGISMMFSSTIIGLKLLPTTVMHHQRTGEVVISILLMQDIIAIFSLLALNAMHVESGNIWKEILWVVLGLPALLIGTAFAERYILNYVLKRFNGIHEYIFLLAIGWCLALAELAEYMGLSSEIGAFIAGVSLAASPIARFIAESLKPLRDFFLVLFFFSLGAGIDLLTMSEILLFAVLLASVMLIAKPIVFRMLLIRVGDDKARAWEVGMRLGQASEFSLLVGYLALNTLVISHQAYHLIQGATLITFIVSSYLVILQYPTPVALSDKMRRD